jgi:hypothetical protein
MKQYFNLMHLPARKAAKRAIDNVPDGMMCLLDWAKRSNLQNSKLWPMLGDVAEQVCWHGRWLSSEDWKNMFTANLFDYDVVPNLDGTGFVGLGKSTSKMNKKQFSDLIELIYAFGADKGVIWSESIPANFDEYNRQGKG